MAFDFGAALSSVGQIAPALSEGAEIRRQRAADAAAVSQRAVSSQDEHEARLAQTAREQQLTKLDERNQNRLTPLSTKPEKGEDGKYYMLFAGPDGRPVRLPVDGNYDPNLEKKALLKSLNIPEDSDLGKQVLLGLKPTTPQFQAKQDADGNWQWIEKPGTGLPSSVSPSAASSAATPGPSGNTGVIPTGVKGRMPVGLTPTQTTSSHVYHWVDNQGQVHETPYTTTSKRGPQAPVAAAPPSVVPAQRPASAPKPSGLIGGDRIVGTGKLPAASLKVVTTAQPVMDQATKLIQNIDSYGLANNNTSGYLAKDYLAYKAGHAAPAGTLANDIAGLSLGSVVEAAAALSGSSRSIQALKLALVHTPNPWIDSPKLLREKLVTINDRLQDVVNEAKTAGQGAPKTGSQAPTSWEQTATSTDGQTKIGLRKGKWFNIATGQEMK
jgi:hypothetical protein